MKQQFPGPSEIFNGVSGLELRILVPDEKPCAETHWMSEMLSTLLTNIVRF